MSLLATLGGKTNYPYAVARVQAKRAKLIPPGEYAKILKMDVAEITRFIEESQYKTEVDELASRFRGLDLLEAALTVNEERTFQSVRSLLAGDGAVLVGQWLQRFIVDDLKTILRGKAAGASREELLKEMLLEDLGAFELFAPLFADEVKTVEDAAGALERQGGVARELAKALQKVPPGSPLARYEDALDKHHFATLLSSLQGLKTKGVADVIALVRREVDAVNTLNALRWVHAGVEADFAPFAIPGGRHMGVDAAIALSKAKDLQQADEMLQDNALYPALKPGLDAARQTGRLSPLQAAVQRSLFADADRLGHSDPLSILPVLIFLMRKHREVVTLRAIARGKAAGLSEARLQELLP